MTLSREDAEMLLPFLANGTLEGDELAQVQEAVENDAALAAELSVLQGVRKSMQDQDVAFSPGEMGLARLMRDIEPHQQRSVPVNRPYIWQIAAAVLLAVVIGQAVLLPTADRSGPGYELAGGGQATFTIAVRPDTTEAALRTLLLEAGVEIVSGPSAIGLYGLAVLEGTVVDDARDRLRAATNIIETLDEAE